MVANPTTTTWSPVIGISAPLPANVKGGAAGESSPIGGSAGPGRDGSPNTNVIRSAVGVVATRISVKRSDGSARVVVGSRQSPDPADASADALGALAVGVDDATGAADVAGGEAVALEALALADGLEADAPHAATSTAARTTVAAARTACRERRRVTESSRSCVMRPSWRLGM